MPNLIFQLSLFKRAFSKTKQELGISLLLVLLLTVILSIVFYIAEHIAQPEVFSKYSDAFVWAYTRYIEGGDGIFDGNPETVTGKIVATLLGFTGIAIVAIPAGIFGSGFIDAMEASRREKELKDFHKKMLRAFPVGAAGQLKKYLDTLSKDESAWYSGCKFGYVNNNAALSKFEIQGMDLKDVLDVCREYPEFRVRNEASLTSIEGNKMDRYMLEYCPVNRRYGYFVNRGSKVTIVSPKSRTEMCVGNFSYYLAKFAGFNYISVDFIAADGESYYNNHWKEPFYEGATLQERKEKGEKITKEIKAAYKNKKVLRDEFLADLESLCKEEGSWVINLVSHVKNQNDTLDVQLTHTLSDGTSSSILSGKETYKSLLTALRQSLKDEFRLSADETTTHPLAKRGSYRNLAYKLQDDGCKCNVLTLSVSTDLMEFDTRMRPVQFLMSKTIHDVIEPEHRLLPEEIEDMNRTTRFHGYADQKVDEIKGRLFPSE